MTSQPSPPHIYWMNAAEPKVYVHKIKGPQVPKISNWAALEMTQSMHCAVLFEYLKWMSKISSINQEKMEQLNFLSIFFSFDILLEFRKS